MERRSLLRMACAIMPVQVLTGRANAATSDVAKPDAAKPDIAKPDMAKVVYHLADLDKVDFVLGNIRNHFNGMGGPDKVTIAGSSQGFPSRGGMSGRNSESQCAKASGPSTRRMKSASPRQGERKSSPEGS